MTIVRLALALALVGCSSSSSSDDQAPIDASAGSGAACTGAVYDTCMSNAQCMSQNCHLYNANALQICTTVCSATVPCPPDSSGAAVACNMMGNCKPSVANNCHL